MTQKTFYFRSYRSLDLRDSARPSHNPEPWWIKYWSASCLFRVPVDFQTFRDPEVVTR